MATKQELTEYFSRTTIRPLINEQLHKLTRPSVLRDAMRIEIARLQELHPKEDDEQADDDSHNIAWATCARCAGLGVIRRATADETEKGLSLNDRRVLQTLRRSLTGADDRDALSRLIHEMVRDE